MSKKRKKHKKRPEVKPQKQQEQGDIDPKGGWLMSLTDFFFDSAYDVITWVLIALSVGALLVFFFNKNWRGTMWAAGMLLVCVMAMLLIKADRYFFRVQTPSEAAVEPFAISVPSAIVTPQRSLETRARFSYKTKFGATLSPIHRLMLIRLTNLQSVRSAIKTYKVEVQNSRGEWLQLIHIENSTGFLYWIAENVKEGRLMEVDRLDAILVQRPIDPKETIEGAAFFEIPEDLGAKQGVRIYVRDFGGAEMTKVISSEEWEPGWKFRPSLEIVDLSKGYKVGYYSEINR